MKLILIFLFSAIAALAQTPEWSRKYHTGSVTCLDFSSDGGKLLSGGRDNTVKLWSVTLNDTLKTYAFLPAYVGEFVLNVEWNITDSFFIASTNKYGSTSLHFQIDTVGNYLDTISISKDLTINSSQFGRFRGLGSQNFVAAYLYHGDKKAIVAASGIYHRADGGADSDGSDGRIDIWDFDSQKVERNITRNSGDFFSMQMSPDKKYFAFASYYSVFPRSTHRENPSHESVVKSYIYDILSDKYIHLDYASQINAWEKNHVQGQHVNQIAFTANSKKLLTSTFAGSIYVRSVLDGRIIDSLSTFTSKAIAIAADLRERYYFSAHTDSTLRLWTPGIPNIFKRMQLQSPVTTIAVSPDSVHFATAHTDGTVAYWNIDSLFLKTETDSVFTPSITSLKDKIVHCLGTNAVFEVSAQSNFEEELFYQWKKGGVNLENSDSISGVRTSKLLLSNLSKASEGQYEVEVLTSKGGRNILNTMHLTVIDSPEIIKQPYLITGGIDYLKIDIKNPEISQFQWYKNGEIIQSANSSDLPLRAYRDSGIYHSQITNSCKFRDSEKFYYYVKATSIEENPFKNTQLSAEPNPFKNSTTIRFSLPNSLKIKLAVTDIRGREIAVLKDGFVEIGEQKIVFKNEDLPDGTYFITLSGDGLLQTIPVQIVR